MLKLSNYCKLNSRLGETGQQLRKSIIACRSKKRYAKVFWHQSPGNMARWRCDQ